MKCQLKSITVHYETFGEGKQQRKLFNALVNEWIDRVEENVQAA